MEGRGVTGCYPFPAFLNSSLAGDNSGPNHNSYALQSEQGDGILPGRLSREMLLRHTGNADINDMSVHIPSDLGAVDTSVAGKDVTHDLPTSSRERRERREPEACCFGSSGKAAAFCGRVRMRIIHGFMCDPVLTTRVTIMENLEGTEPIVHGIPQEELARLILEVMLAFLITVMTYLTWYFTATHAERSVSQVADALRQELLARTEDNTKALLHNNNVSVTAISRLLSSSIVSDNFSSYETLDHQVGPILFASFSVLPQKTVVSYFGKNGLFMSYAQERNMTALVFANASYSGPAISNTSTSPGVFAIPRNSSYRWFEQQIDASSGLPVGHVSQITAYPYWAMDIFSSSFSDMNGKSSWGIIVARTRELLIASLSPVRRSSGTEVVGTAVVGASISEIRDFLDTLDLKGGDMYLTTADGRLLVQTKEPVSFESTPQGTLVLPYATMSNNSVVSGAADYLAKLDSNATQNFQSGNVKIHGVRYILNSSPIKIADTRLACVVLIPRDSVWGSTDKRSRTILALLLILAICVGLVGCFFTILLTKGVNNEMHLRAALIQQLEATKQAENRSSHKSIVFASMSHDLRTPLAAILGLIDLCLCDSVESPEVESNLLQMKSCATNLLGILNSILDMSKIEAGKLQLEESEFDLVEVLEEAVEMFAVVGLKKGLEVVLDLPDDSVEKASRVLGDASRVKQVLSNLLSNGVKFTSEGHVVLRAWHKPMITSGIIPNASQADGFLGCLTNWFWKLFTKSEKRYEQMERETEALGLGGLLEFEFEVDDTGKGIPRDRRNAVFENFVQVDSSVPRTHGGTGLGLGIVRSLVRLMGGDINIIDKDEPGEPGSCFRFNLFFHEYQDIPLSNKGSEASPVLTPIVEERVGASNLVGSDSAKSKPNWQVDSDKRIGLEANISSCHVDSGVTEGIHVLLAMQGQAGKKVVKQWLERRGLQVWTVSHWEDLLPTLEKIKFEVFYACGYSWSDGFEISQIQAYDSWIKDSISQLPPSEEGPTSNYFRKVNSSRVGGRLLLVIDTGMIPEPPGSLSPQWNCSVLPRELSDISRVVWLVTPNTPSSVLQSLKQGVVPCDLVLQKPLHISRLCSLWEQVLLLSENRELVLPQTKRLPSWKENPHESLCSVAPSFNSNGISAENGRNFEDSLVGQSPVSSNAPGLEAGEQDIQQNTYNEISLVPPAECKIIISDGNPGSFSQRDGGTFVHSSSPSPDLKSRARETEIMGPPNSLRGMHILVAEDNPVLQRLTKTTLIRLGASVECVDNGEEAFQLVIANLPRKLSGRTSSFGSFRKLMSTSKEQDEEATPKKHPFDIVLMDCQMPVLDGYAATQRIREQEKLLGHRTPVIALTASAMSKDESRCIEAGMDFYLTKPLATKALLSVVAKINASSSNATKHTEQ